MEGNAARVLSTEIGQSVCRIKATTTSKKRVLKKEDVIVHDRWSSVQVGHKYQYLKYNCFYFIVCLFVFGPGEHVYDTINPHVTTEIYNLQQQPYKECISPKVRANFID